EGPLGPPTTLGPLTDTAVEASQLAEQLAVMALQFGPPAIESDQLSFGLTDALVYAAENSRDYQDQLDALYLTALDVTLERHLFSPRYFAGGSINYDDGQRDAGFPSALRSTARAGVRQQLPYGGEVVAEALVRFVDAFNDSVADGEEAEIALSATIPLLRGAGWVNLEPLIRAERSLVYQVREFERFRRRFAVDVASRYFRLIAFQQSVRNNYLNYQLNLRLLEQVQANYGAGRQQIQAVQRAANSLLRAEDALNDAETRYQNSLDDFKILLGMPVTTPLEIVPQDIDVAELPDDVAQQQALTFRLDLQTARDRVDDNRRSVEVTENALLPRLDLLADARIGNRTDTPARQIDGRTAEYGVGLNLDLPVDRVAERNNYRAALIRLERAKRDVDELSDVVIADVRASLRNLRSARLTVRIQRQSLEVARQRLDYANESLRLGVDNVDTEDVVDAQDALLGAQESLDNAQSNLRIQLLQLLRDTGTLRVDPAAGVLGTALQR
ncbi:MAG: TolC family protein, partial [Planctomycetota bacterium]